MSDTSTPRGTITSAEDLMPGLTALVELEQQMLSVGATQEDVDAAMEGIRQIGLQQALEGLSPEDREVHLAYYRWLEDDLRRTDPPESIDLEG